jgi:hypothetical protein
MKKYSLILIFIISFIIPGAGHLYIEDTKIGMIFFCAFLGGLILGVTPISIIISLSAVWDATSRAHSKNKARLEFVESELQ